MPDNTKKVALPLDVDGKSYWEAMILGITNGKLCSLRANFKQDFKVSFIQYKHENGSVMLMRQLFMCFISMQMTR